MTVIAWDGKTLAADKRATINGYPATTTKIRRTPWGDLLASCGDAGTGRALIDWYVNGAVRSEYPENQMGDDGCRSTMMVIGGGGEIRLYQRDPFPIILENKFHAMGSGADFALAALHLGHDARKAVEVACELDNDCGNGIDTLELKS